MLCLPPPWQECRWSWEGDGGRLFVVAFAWEDAMVLIVQVGFSIVAVGGDRPKNIMLC
jgi:hypothetical protein